MDNELKQLAALALRNAFWHDFSGLVNAYLAAAEGLNVSDQESLMSETASVYGRDTKAEANESVNIWTRKANGYTCGHATMLEALEYAEAIEVHVKAKKVFERRDGEWYCVE